MSPLPAKPNSPRRRSERSRAAILRAAERVFADEGLAGARTEAIAEAAGVNKALLYYYFKSKDDLYVAVLESHLREFSGRALAILRREGSARAILLDYVDMRFDMVSRRPNFPRLMLRVMLSGGGAMERLTKRYSLPLARELVRLIERGVRRGEFRAVD